MVQWWSGVRYTEVFPLGEREGALPSWKLESDGGSQETIPYPKRASEEKCGRGTLGKGG